MHQKNHSAIDRLVVREGTYSLSAIDRLGVREGTMEQTLSEPTATFCELNYILHRRGTGYLCSRCCFGGTPPKRGACCSPRAICKQQLLCLLDRFSSLCVRHISRVCSLCSLFDQHVARRLPEHLPSVLQTSRSGTGANAKVPRCRCCSLGAAVSSG